jgi:cobalt/nickel transport system permease protein
VNELRGEPLLAGDVGSRDGPLSIDPRLRLLAAGSFAVAVISLDSWQGPVAAMTIAGLAAIAAGPSWSTLLRRLLAMDGLMLFVLASLPFTVPGEQFIRLAGLEASREGLMQAGVIIARANAILIMILALLGSMPVVTLGHALQRLYVPATLVHLMLFTVRYLDVVGNEYERLRRAMTARAFRPGTDRHTLRSLGWLLGMLLVRSVEKAERVVAAMKCRGFTGRMPSMNELRLRPIDGLFALTGAVVFGALFWLERG